MSELKQSTATYISFGPFLDATDGSTPETGLSPTVYVSKNGGAYATRNSVTAISHDRKGHYRIHLDATDTGTLGVLTVNVADETTHLDVTKEYSVVSANYYDTKYSTDKFTVDISEVNGTSVTDVDDFKADVTNMSTFNAGTDNVTVGDITTATLAKYSTEDTGETTPVAGSVAELAQGAAGGNVTVGGYTTAALLELIQTDTGETTATAGSVGAIAQGGSSLNSADVTTACETAIDNKGLVSTAGTGATATEITITDNISNPLDGVEVWATTDSAGTNVAAGTLTTSATGKVTFMLDPGTYYIWKQKAGYDFTNPETKVVS